MGLKPLTIGSMHKNIATDQSRAMELSSLESQEIKGHIIHSDTQTVAVPKSEGATRRIFVHLRDAIQRLNG